MWGFESYKSTMMLETRLNQTWILPCLRPFSGECLHPRALPPIKHKVNSGGYFECRAPGVWVQDKYKDKPKLKHEAINSLVTLWQLSWILRLVSICTYEIWRKGWMCFIQFHANVSFYDIFCNRGNNGFYYLLMHH